MVDWFILAIIASLLFGVQAFLYKVGVRRNFNKFELTFSFTLTAAFLSLLLFLFKRPEASIKLILGLGGLYGLFFFLKTIGQMKALRFLPTNIVFPITSSNVALVVILAMVFLKESLTYLQIIGIILIILVITLFYTEKQRRIKKEFFKLGILIAILAMIFSAAASFTNKIAAINVNKELFIAISYFISAFLAGSFVKFGGNKKTFSKRELKLGILIGVINFMGFYTLLYALSVGPLSVISPIIALYVLVVAILGYLFYKEELSPRRIFLIILSIIAVTFLKI